MSTKEFTIRNYYTRDIPIDDGVDGEAVAAGQTFPIRIRRFSVAQLQAFQRGWARANAPTQDRFIFRQPDGEEQQMREVPAVTAPDSSRVLVPARSEHVIPDHEIERRRLQEMTPEVRAAYEAAVTADDEFNTTFASQAISDHIWLPPGVTVKVIHEDVDEHGNLAETVVVARDGRGLVDAFGGNISMLLRLVRAIAQENTLTPEAKKAWRLLSGSTASSPTPAAVAAIDGERPAATATSAGAAASAPSDGASEDPELSLSGLSAT